MTELLPRLRAVLAAMLEVRRPPVTIAACRLQRAGLIHYRRGRMRVLDRERLRAAARDDYRRTQEIYDRCFPGMDGAGPLRVTGAGS